MQDRSKTQNRSLFDTDFVVWCREQARLVRERRFGELDVDNVAEELDTMGRSDKRQIESRLAEYTAARLKASDETGIEYSLFPETSPFTADRILDPEFLPAESHLDEGQ